MKNHKLLCIIVFLLFLPIVTAWYPYGNNIFQNQVEGANGFWTNTSNITTVTNSGAGSDYQALTGDVDNDGDLEIVMVDGTTLKVLTQSTLAVEDSYAVGTVSGQPTITNIDPDANLEIMVTGTLGGIDKLFILQHSGSTLSATEINITNITLAGASPKCWYQTNASLYAYNKAYCVFRTYNDTYVKVWTSNQTIIKFSWNGTNYATPSIPILANIDEDANAVPEFYVMRTTVEAVMIDTEYMQPHASFLGGGSTATKGTGIVEYGTVSSGSCGGSTSGFTTEPILYQNDGGGQWEILTMLGTTYCDISVGLCNRNGQVIWAIDYTGATIWTNIRSSGCGSYGGGGTWNGVYKATQPLVADFYSGNAGNEICFLSCEGITTGSVTCGGIRVECLDFSGTTIGTCTTGAVPTDSNNLTLALGSTGAWTEEEVTASDITNSGQDELIFGVGVLSDLCATDKPFITNGVEVLGLTAGNDKSLIPITDSSGNVQLLYTSDTGSPAGTKYYTIEGAGAGAGNDNPSITSITATPTSRNITTGQSVQFVIAGTDNETDPLYTAKRCKTTDSATAFTFTNTQTCTYTTAGFFTARLYLTDDQHLTDYSVFQDLQVNVSVTSPFCGNGVCDGNETTATCPSDCSTGSTGSSQSYQLDLQTDLVNVNAPVFDASQQGLLGNLYLGTLEFLSLVIKPIFTLFIFMMIFLVVMLILSKIKTL